MELNEKELLKIFKLISDDLYISKVNNIDYLFIGNEQKLLLTPAQAHMLRMFKEIGFEDFIND